MVEKKNLLFLLAVVIMMAAGTLPASAATYYVKNGGDDSADGLTDTTAWKTISKVNSETFSPGDIVCFKRGDTWRIPIDAQLIPRSGSSAGHITYSAYGEGPKPLFLGSVEKNSPSDWTLTGTPNVWATANNSFILDIGNIIFNNEQSCGHKQMDSGSLKSQGDFYYDAANESVLLYSASNPAAYYSDIECAVKKHIVAIVDKSYVTISNLDIRYSGAHGIQGRNVSYLTIQDCDISYIGGSFHMRRFSKRSGTSWQIRYGNAIEFWESAHDILVQRNKIRDIYDAGLTNQSGGESGISQYNIYYRYNVVWNCAYSYEYFARNPATKIHDIYIENNIFANAGYGWSYNEIRRGRGKSLAFWQLSGTESDFYIRNNIIYEAKQYCLNLPHPMPGLISEYNCWYKASGDMIKYGKTVYSMSQFPAYQADTGWEANSIAADPVFVDVAGNDYRLQSVSGCINKGLDIGLTQDFDYNPIVPPGFPDIGAFEYQPTNESTGKAQQRICPVMGGSINKDIFTEYKGRKVYFCCAGCKPMFEKAPEKYVGQLPQFNNSESKADKPAIKP